MPNLAKLNDEECSEQLARLNRNLDDHWEVNVEEKLTKVFHFSDFSQAWGFMTKVAAYAQTHAHHPEWSNCYNRVRIDLTTHDVNGISKKDFALARLAEQARNR